MSVAADRLARARTVADTVLYEGYLLYPYRASSEKNQARWQFGVLGPPGAFDRGLGEPDSMTMHTLLRDVSADSSFVVHLRFLQLQHRQVRDPGRPRRRRVRRPPHLGRGRRAGGRAHLHRLASSGAVARSGRGC